MRSKLYNTIYNAPECAVFALFDKQGNVYLSYSSSLVGRLANVISALKQGTFEIEQFNKHRGKDLRIVILNVETKALNTTVLLKHLVSKRLEEYKALGYNVLNKPQTIAFKKGIEIDIKRPKGVRVRRYRCKVMLTSNRGTKITVRHFNTYKDANVFLLKYDVETMLRMFVKSTT